MDGVPNVGTAWWYGAAGLRIYKFNDKLTATVRNELFEDNRGFRTGSRGLYYETTLGVTWSPIRSPHLPSLRPLRSQLQQRCIRGEAEPLHGLHGRDRSLVMALRPSDPSARTGRSTFPGIIL